MENTEVDTLKKFGTNFQSKTIAGIISDKAFLERVFDIIDIKYWESDADQWIIQTTMDYYMQYKTPPTLDVFKVKLGDVKHDVLKKSIVEHLKAVYQKLSDSDLKFVNEQFLEFCKNQKLKTAIVSSVDLLKSGHYEKIKHNIDEALKAGMEKNIGHDYINDVDERMTNIIRKCVKTGFPVIDQLLDGGLGAGELGVVVASAGIGKSWVLVRLGANAMLEGKNVLHVTLELNECYVGRRYDACFSSIDFQDIAKNIETVKGAIDKVKGKLFIKYFPIKTVSANSVKLHLERLKMLGHNIDLLIVDYADILRPFALERGSNSYNDAGNIYEELRGVAGELQIPTWSASQANRSSSDEEIVQAHNIADSFRKIMTADFVLSMSRKINDKQNNTARCHIIKNRFGPDGQTLPCLMNTSNGDIQMYEPTTLEGIESTKRMGSTEESVKSLLSNKWNEMKPKQETASF